MNGRILYFCGNASHCLQGCPSYNRKIATHDCQISKISYSLSQLTQKSQKYNLELNNNFLFLPFHNNLGTLRMLLRNESGT